MIWYKEKANDDIIVSTRIRLARNLAAYPFPNAMTADQMKKASAETENAIIGRNSALAKMFRSIHLDDISAADAQILAEKHLISYDLLKKKNASVMISNDETMSIMLMEEDHIRLQIILPGFQPDKAWETASRVDDVLEEGTEYAFDSEFGYLTSCPTNTGTGLRASVMMHLPALTMTDNISGIISSAGRLGIAVRGLYGEGSKAYGSLYQISNQITLGISEEDIIERLKNIVGQIKENELQARKMLVKNSKIALEDKLWRSYGILSYARSISSAEAKSLLSDVILGKSMGIIKTDENLMELMIETEPGFIEGSEKKRLSPDGRDQKRAEYIRSRFAEAKTI